MSGNIALVSSLFAIENLLSSATCCPQRRSSRITVVSVKQLFTTISELVSVCQTQVGLCCHLPHKLQQQEVTPATRAALDFFNHFGACNQMLHKLMLWQKCFIFHLFCVCCSRTFLYTFFFCKSELTVNLLGFCHDF